jgi:hypothetical protein
MSKYWKVNNEIDDNLLKEIIKKIPSNTFYQLNQKKNIYTFLEKLVYNITTFHCNRLNINNDFIEFGFIEKNIDFIKKDGELLIVSILVFFDNTNNPLLITNLTEDQYKYKKFNNINISCSFPKKLNHVIFEPNKYYYSLHNEKTLIINVYDKNYSNSISFPEKIFSFNNYFMYNTSELSFDFVENEFKTVLFNESKTGFNYDYFDELIYLDSSKYENLIKLIDKNDNYDIFEFKLDKFKLSDRNIIDKCMERFIQRFIKKKHYQPYICDWIIKKSEKYASENGGWTTNRHIKYPTTDLPINKITTIFPFIFESLQSITGFIKKSYCLDEKYVFKFDDIFIVKYDATLQNHLIMHKDKSVITVNTLLSDPSEFEGGGTYFDDDITTYLEKGDSIIHGGNTKHSGLEITKGKRYVLVTFIQIYDPDR